MKTPAASLLLNPPAGRGESARARLVYARRDSRPDSLARLTRAVHQHRSLMAAEVASLPLPDIAAR